MRDSTKFCPDCGEHRPLSDFQRNRHKSGGYQTYCRDHLRTRQRHRVISLDRRDRFGRPLHERLPCQAHRHDPTYEKVFAWLGFWMKRGILTSKQAEAIYLHAVEELDYEEIGTLCNVDGSGVMRLYERGIARLRELYAGYADAV